MRYDIHNRKISHRLSTITTVATTATLIGLLGATTSAWAAGSGYGPPVVVTKGVAQGFRGVVTAVTVNESGKVIHIKNHGISAILHVGGCRSNFQVIVTNTSAGAIDKSHYKNVPKSVFNGKVIYSIGVLIQSGTREIASCKIENLDVYNKTFSRNDYVLYYNSRLQAFSSAPKYHASVSKNHVIAKFRTDTEIVVVGPNTPKKTIKKK